MDAKEILQLKHKNTINFKNSNIPVFRVIPIDRLLQLFNEKKNTLVKPELWDDPFENFFLKSKGRSANNTIISLDDLRKNLYGQCWTLNEEETDALWRIYSPFKNGVRIKTTVNKLFDSFFNESDDYAPISYFVGRVFYDDEDKIVNYFEKNLNAGDLLQTDGKGIVKTLLIKRKEFKHENEARLIYFNQRKKITDNFFKYNFDTNNIIEEILFDPRMEHALYQTYESIIKNFGFAGSIIKSKLYQFRELNLRFNI